MNGKKILLVDDDLAFCEMLTEILQSKGAEVIVEHDGKSGFERALKEHPDLVMFDMMMPVMTGVVALEKLRSDPWGKTVSAILLTNISQPDSMPTGEGCGHTEYLLKVDWTLSDIADKIERLFQAV